MIAAILDSLPIAIGILIATLPLLAVPLILASQPTTRVLKGFLAGWALGFMGLGGLVIAFADLTAPAKDAPAVWVVWLRLVLGLVLLWLAWSKWQNRPQPGAEPELPGWMASIETMGMARAVTVAVLLVTVNPKNAVLVMAGALAIASATYMPLAQAGALVVFTLISSLGIAAPLVLRLVSGPAALTQIDRLKSLLARHNRLIMTLVLVAMGLIVTVNAVVDILGPARF